MDVVGYNTVWESLEQKLKATGCAYHHHSNGEIGPELVVTPGTRGTIGVFVNASFVHKLWMLFMFLLWIS